VATGVFKETKAAAEGFSLQLQSYEVTTIQDDEKAFTEMAKVRPNGLIVLLTPLVTLHSKRIVGLALHQRLAGVYPTRQFAEEGGLMAYGPLKIFKGAKPTELPIEQPTKFELVINLKTAQQIGLTIPQSVLYRADKVIR
jgi:putative ABC transport system substrate-binding protein